MWRGPSAVLQLPVKARLALCVVQMQCQQRQSIVKEKIIYFHIICHLVTTNFMQSHRMKIVQVVFYILY